MSTETIMIVGGSKGMGRALAELHAERGNDVLILGKDHEYGSLVAREIGHRTKFVSLDLAAPQSISKCLTGIGKIDRLVVTAIERSRISIVELDAEAATRQITIKTTGVLALMSALRTRFADDSSIVLFGGLTREWPRPFTTIPNLINGATTSLVRTLAFELQPTRVNAVHPGVVIDTEAGMAVPTESLERARERVPGGRLPLVKDILNTVEFLLYTPGINGQNVAVDGGDGIC